MIRQHVIWSLPAAVLLVASTLPAQPPAAPLAGHTDAVSAAAYSPDGRLIVTASFDRSVKIWDAATGKEVRTLAGHEGQVLALALSGDGRRIVTGSRDRARRPSGPGCRHRPRCCKGSCLTLEQFVS